MQVLGPGVRVYMVLGATDLRKSIDGLSVLVASQLGMDAFSGGLFVFCNRGRNMVKVLYWDRNGFCLWQKRLERHRFPWPESAEQVLSLGMRELTWLLEGLDPLKVTGHPRLSYDTLY